MGELLSPEDLKRLKEFQAMYYELNAKPDTTTKIFQKDVFVKMEDLQYLSNLVDEKLALHQKEGTFGKSYVSVTMSKHKSYSFDNWQLFLEHNWKVSEYIESITLVWDFYLIVEGYKNPQRHKLTVKISSGLKPEEVLSLLLSGKVEDIDDIDAQRAPIIAQMDFIENRLGQEFINIVSEWVESLTASESEQNKFMLALKKRKKLVAYYFNYVLFLILCITFLCGCNLLIKSFEIERLQDMTIGNFRCCINYIVISILCCSAVLNWGEAVANKVFRKLTDYGETYVFRITKGDENQYNTIKSNEKKNSVVIILQFILSLIFNVACSIIGAVIFGKL